ncbi:MAG: hypothetical protein U9P44_03100, partial [archaeon]|nr:hypothetical protein [archaeon]
AYEYEYYGEYRFSIGGIYTNQFIEVKLPEKFTINTTGNHSVNFSIENIKGQKLYNLEVQEDYDEEYIDVNMSDPVDIDKDKTINITTIIISSQELENGNYEEILEIIVCGDTLEMPLIFDVDINPRAEITNDDFDGVEFNMTIFKDITSQENIKIKNIGQRDMETPAIYFLGNDLIENATAVQPAGTVAVNESVNVVVKFYFDEVKTYTGTLWVSAPNMADIGYNITITVLEGMTSRIDVLSDRLALAGNLRDQLEYNATIKKLDINFSKIDEMILNTTNLRSYILSKSIDPENYEDIKDNITEFEAMLDKIDEDLEDMEKSYKLLIMPKGGDGKCDESESCSSSDCEYEKRCITEDATEKENVCGDSVCSVEDNECSTCPADCPSYLCEAVLNPTDDEGGQQSPKSFTFIIIAAVIILLIGSVLITSLVPEKEDGTKSSASFDI